MITSFVLFNALIGFFSDIILNLISNYKILNINTLRPYFDNHGMFIAALYAMITVIIIVYIILFIHKLLFKKYLPTNLKEELIFYLLSFIIGFIADIMIHKLNIFPKLKLYYSVIGSGLWGGLAILFSVFVSIQLLKYR